MSTLSLILLALVLLPLGVSLFRIAFHQVLTWRFFARYEELFPAEPWTPSVSVVVPVRGVEPGSASSFATVCRQEYAGDWEVLFCVEEPEDPAVPVLEGSWPTTRTWRAGSSSAALSTWTRPAR